MLVVVTLILIVPTGAVSAQDRTISPDIIYLEDGGYILIEITNEHSITRAVATKNKHYTRYNGDDEMLWKITLTGSFTYNGTTASCTSSSCTVTIYSDAWYTDSKTAWASSNTAYATVEMGRKMLGVTVRRETVDLALTCDKNGNFS